MKLKKITLPHLPKGAEEGGQGKAAWRIAAFFLLMLALTLFARGMAGAAQTAVTTQTPRAATVTETLALSGTVESQSVEVLTLPDGLTVQSVLVTEGQTVQEGDGLIQVDTDTIAQALTQAQGELDKLNLQLEAYQEEETADESALSSAQTAYDRAKEDAASAASAQSTQVSRAKSAVSEAKSALSDAKSDLKALKNQRSALNSTITQEKETLADLEGQLAEAEQTAQAAEDASGVTPEPEAVSAEVSSLEAQIEALETQITADEEALASCDEQITSAQEAVESAQAAVDAAEEALEDANTAASDSSRSSQRTLEDAQTALSEAQDSLAQAKAAAETQNLQNQAEAQILSVTIAQQEAEVAALTALQDSGGVLTAPYDGKIVSLTGAAGGSSGQVEVQLTAEGDSYVLTLTGSVLAEVPDGATLQVTQGDAETSVSIAALVQDGGTGTLTATAYLTGDWMDGDADVTVTLSSSRYELTIPIGAYHEDNGGGFVYVVEEVESVLGLRYQIRREAVTLLASNSELAAVDGVLSGDSLIVTAATRSVEDGEYVRMSV
ncbi:MAG: biotin/lipoyl-binding protein [Clostridiales bacterium]|nr:biotin/lipoyl-binding protein [Clostridiales bacterium]